MTENPAKPRAARLPYWEFVTIVALLMALNAMAIDVILPALQQIGASLDVADENTRQLPLTAYIAVFGLSQLVYGTISDHFGRRPVLIFGLVIYVIGCTGAAFSGNFPMLLAMRGLQGFGAGATRVIAMSVIRDTFGGRRMASVMSLAMMVFMGVPIIAPGIGQIILMVSGWRAILGFIALFGLDDDGLVLAAPAGDARRRRSARASHRTDARGVPHRASRTALRPATRWPPG